MTDNATPRPWKYWQSKNTVGHVSQTNAEFIAVCYGFRYDKDALDTVNAVNVHDELVDALYTIAVSYDALTGPLTEFSREELSTPALIAVRRIAAAALAKAKGKQ